MDEDGVLRENGGNVKMPENYTPPFLMAGLSTALSTIERYGWFIVIGSCVLMYLYQKYKPSYDKWRQKCENMKQAEEYKKDPEKAHKIQLSMEEARLKMQERVKADYEIKKKREQEFAEQKRLQKIEEWEKHKQGRGYHSKSRPQETEKSKDEVNGKLKPKTKSSFRPEFNPLSGSSGGSSGYRPSRRNVSGGG